jgi:MFS family permease
MGVAGPIAAGVILIGLFVWWEARSRTPMVPLRFFRRRAFSAANVTSMLMSFGMFGSVFLLAQFFQIVQHYSPLQAGLRTLPWTAMPILVAPVAGLLSDRIGSRPLLVSGMGLMAGALVWIASVASPTVPYLELVAPFALGGIGMSLYFAPVANVVLSAVRRNEEGKASGVSNTVREVGGVFGVAVLASIFAAAGGYASPTAFTDGLDVALLVGAVVVGVGTVAALGIPGRKAVALQASPLQLVGAQE